MTLEDWIDQAVVALNLDEDDVDVDALLDVARDVAHAVERRAAPVTTYLLGPAVGRGASIDAAATKVSELAKER